MADKHEDSGRQVSRADETVVLVHGLWMPAVVMGFLAWHLRRAGWRTQIFSYSSRHATVRQNAARLAASLGKVTTPTVHFVAHSLGGLVVAQLLQDYPGQRPGRVVMLATPFLGSFVARHFGYHRWARWLCGLSLEGGLLGDGPRWTGGCELGVIAGTVSVGASWITPGMPRPNDGMVGVAETMVPGQTDHISLPVNHSGMLLSAAVARQVIAFLGEGRFSRRPS